MEEKIKDIKKCYVHIIMLKNKLLNYLNGSLSMFDEYDLMNITNKWLFNIQYLYKEHIIQPYNVTISNIPEE